MKTISEERAFRIRRNLKDAGCGMPVVTQFLDWSKDTADGNNTGCFPARKRHCCKSCTAFSIKSIVWIIWFIPCNRKTKKNGGLPHAKSPYCDPGMG